MNDTKEIYLRIYNDMSFLSKLFDVISNEEDTFAYSMLSDRIISEREALRLEQERIDRETLERQVEQEQQQEYKSE